MIPRSMTNSMTNSMSNSMTNSMSTRFSHTRIISIAWMLLNVVLWGAALPIAKGALAITTPYQFLLGRYLWAALLSLPILTYFITKYSFLIRTIPRVIALEFLGTVLALGLLYEGLARTTSLEASLLVTTTPLFTTLGGIWFLREKEERHEVWGLLLALSGTILLAAEPLLSGRHAQASFSASGNLLILLQNAVTASYFVLAKKYYQGIPKLWVTTISFYLGIVGFWLLSAQDLVLTLPQTMLQTWQQWSNWAVLWPIIYMAFFGSIIGLTAYIQGQDGLEASEASLFSYLQPLVYVPLAYWMWQENVNAIMVIAMLIVSAGVVIANRRPKKIRKFARMKKRP